MFLSQDILDSNALALIVAKTAAPIVDKTAAPIVAKTAAPIVAKTGTTISSAEATVNGNNTEYWRERGREREGGRMLFLLLS
jgi:hypothetical protein